MMKFKCGWALIALNLALAFCGPAHAQWAYTKKDDAFDGDQHIAIAADGYSGYFVGFRCSNESDLALIYGTPEKHDGDITDGLSKLSKLAVIIDKTPAVQFDVVLDKWDDDKLRFISTDEGVNALLFQAAKAKRRFAVAVQAMGQNFHSKSFETSGSTRALGVLIKECELSPDEQASSDADDAAPTPANTN
jgi:hypothetical protein